MLVVSVVGEGGREYGGSILFVWLLVELLPFVVVAIFLAKETGVASVLLLLGGGRGE